jgi:hypothetical protein
VVAKPNPCNQIIIDFLTEPADETAGPRIARLWPIVLWAGAVSRPGGYGYTPDSPLERMTSHIKSTTAPELRFLVLS